MHLPSTPLNFELYYYMKQKKADQILHFRFITDTSLNLKMLTC